jgi:HEAT repeat protein
MAEVRDLFVTFTKALRAHQLYDENNPVYQRFVSALRQAFSELWGRVDRLQVGVEEDRLTWMGEEVYRVQNRNDSLAFLFFKDGVRVATFLPGVEKEELVQLMAVIQRARLARAEGDDLLTILWEADLDCFEYKYVDLLAEGIDLPEASDGGLEGLGELLADAEAADEASEDGEPAGDEGTEEGPAVATVSPEDFNPTLYALDPAEMDALQRDLDAEMNSDLRVGVLAGLFDRLEEPQRPDRQSEILGILRTLLPNFLSRGALAPASEVIQELVRLQAEADLMDEQRRQEVDGLLEELSTPAAIGELVKAVEDGSIRPDPRALRSFLSELKVRALGPILRSAERSGDRGAGPLLRLAAGGIVEQNESALLDLMASDDPILAAGAARLAGEMEYGPAGPALSELMTHADPEVRRTAVAASGQIGASTVAGGLVQALDDPESDIRQAAARVLGEMRYHPAGDTLKSIVTGRRIRSAETSEKIAFFEAFGMLAGEAAVPILDKLLNGRGFLGRTEPAEIRACAALGLGQVGTQAATVSLQRAVGETDPVIRSAVSRALKGGQTA